MTRQQQKSVLLVAQELIRARAPAKSSFHAAEGQVRFGTAAMALLCPDASPREHRTAAPFHAAAGAICGDAAELSDGWQDCLQQQQPLMHAVPRALLRPLRDRLGHTAKSLLC